MAMKSQLQHEGVNYKRNLTDVKKYLKASDGPDHQSTGDSVTDGTAKSEVPELPLRPPGERRSPEYLNDTLKCFSFGFLNKF